MSEKAALENVKIVDIINHKNKYSTQMLLVLGRWPDFKHDFIYDLHMGRHAQFLIAEDSGFFNFYLHEQPTGGYRAFAGREFDIQMQDGTTIRATGQWWDGVPDSYNELVVQLGAATFEMLLSCYVFGSIYVDRKIIEDWLRKNDPSNNYYKYHKRNKDYGKHTIVSPWEEID